MKKKTIFFVVAIICLLLTGYAYYLYQKPRAGVEGMSADYSLAATSLYEAFVTNEEAANKKYVNKVLKVEGTVQQVDTLQGGVNVILASNPTEGGVNCILADNKARPSVGQQVIIKGRCTGFLMDVSLVDAVLENK